MQYAMPLSISGIRSRYTLSNVCFKVRSAMKITRNAQCALIQTGISKDADFIGNIFFQDAMAGLLAWSKPCSGSSQGADAGVLEVDVPTEVGCHLI